MKKLLIIASLLAAIASQACTGLAPSTGQSLNTLAPGQTVTLEWDNSDCGFGINSFQIALIEISHGHRSTPPDSVVMDAEDLTTGQPPMVSPSLLFFQQNLCGHVVQLTVTNTGKKSITIEVDTAGNMGGPCQ